MDGKAYCMTAVLSRLSIVLILMAALAPVAAAETKPDITVRSVEPAVAAPGDTVRVGIIVANDGTTRGEFGPVTLETVDGIAVTGSTSSLVERFSLCGGCQRTGTFYLQVDEAAMDGTYPFDVRLPAGDTALIESSEIEVDGRSSLVLTASNVSIVPGETAPVTLELSNIGTDAANEVVVSAETDGFAVSPSARSLEGLDSGQDTMMEFTLRADRDMDAGVRSLAFTATYTEDNTEQETTFSVPVDVAQRAEIAIDNVAGDSLTLGEPSDVTVDIENLGPGEAERISMELACDGAEVQNGRSFVGQLGDGESVPAVFAVVPDQQEVGCDITVQYSDESQRSLEERIEVTAQEQTSVLPYAVVLVVGLLVGGYLWRKKRQDEVAEI
jgi:hypothetical protein